MCASCNRIFCYIQLRSKDTAHAVKSLFIRRSCHYDKKSIALLHFVLVRLKTLNSLFIRKHEHQIPVDICFQRTDSDCFLHQIRNVNTVRVICREIHFIYLSATTGSGVTTMGRIAQSAARLKSRRSFSPN